MINLSKSIIEYISKNFGDDYLENYKKFTFSNYPSYIRLSSIHIDQISIITQLNNQGIDLEKVKGIPSAYKITNGEKLIGKTIEYTLGKYYIQSLSSMIPVLILSPTPNDKVLDLCAAPGSKSTQIAELMEFKGTFYSNEPNPKRIKALVYNLDKTNAVNMWVINRKGELLSKQFPEFFDKILVDVPCSALGVIQKNQEISNWWNLKSVEKLSSLQLKLLISAINMTREGGEIVYSTCTLTAEENEFVIDKVLKKYPVDLQEFNLDVPNIDGYSRFGNYYFNDKLRFTKRIVPWQINSEGFFIAKLKKLSSIKQEKYFIPEKSKLIKIVTAEDKMIRKYIKHVSEYFGIELKIFDEFKYLIRGNDISFTNADSVENNPDNFLRVGIRFGVIDKNQKIKLNSHAAQILGKYASKNIVELKNDNEANIYFEGGIILSETKQNGQRIIKFRNYYLGTGVAFDNKLKSQFPRSKRTSTIMVN